MNFEPRSFLAECWQKQPALIRGAFPGFESPMRPEELAGLALEEGVASRLILERGGKHPWELRLAPHDPDTFENLPDSHWTLLVHEVDQLVPAVGRLLDEFRFLPNWRLDDVMVSYATPGGSIGAHLDHYDVFLLQGFGRRRWAIESKPRPPGEQNVPDLDMRLLAQFDPGEEWILEPGDLLYLPPRIAHHGIAIDACLTYSIGFRAPHQKQLAAAFAADLTERADPELRYRDPNLVSHDEPGAIDAATLARVRKMLARIEHQDDELAHWFGRFATKPRRERAEPDGDEERNPASLRAALEQSGLQLCRSAPGRFAHYRHAGGDVTLFVGGQAYRLTGHEAGFAPLLTGQEPLDARTLGGFLKNNRVLDLLASWVQEGYLILDDDAGRR